LLFAHGIDINSPANNRTSAANVDDTNTALEREDLSRTYLAHHELESVVIIIIIIIIVIMVTINTDF